jgi:ribonuclease Z
MRLLFEPRLVNDAFGDPCLYVDFRDERRALLFDLGDIAALPPRKLLRLTHVFVSHAHMDHFSGFDQLLRIVLGRKERLVLLGGPGFIAQVEHKLQAYTWNVVQRYEVGLVIEAAEIGVDGRCRRACFPSRSRFEREVIAESEVSGDVLHEEATFRVRGRFVDHDIPCLAFLIEEKGHVNVGKDRLAQLGLPKGAWLRELKHAVLSGAPPDTAVQVRWRDRDGEHGETRRVGDLAALVVDVSPGQRIGYVTDLRYTEANLEALSQLLAGVDLLFIESVFLDEDRGHAARKNHLTARQAGEIARRVGARAVVPFHFSPRYEGRSSEIVAELEAAWSGTQSAPCESEQGGRSRPVA